ncbi:MAG: radical SAM protein [bacterium]|nr:radical SAM protein [bacterium]
MDRKFSNQQGSSLIQRDLFPTLIYGPVRSRRLGASLGINPLPLDVKLCSFNCPYCQFGWTGFYVGDVGEAPAELFPTVEAVGAALEEALERLASDGTRIDSLTFAGNGEPTLHPEFSELVDVVAAVRDRLAPEVKLSILTSASTIHRPEVLEALNRLDERQVKLDAGDPETIQAVNLPHRPFDLQRMIAHISGLTDCIVQSMFVQGRVDNTTDDIVAAWIDKVEQIRPLAVQLYTLDRIPADTQLKIVPRDRLDAIAGWCQESTGVACEVY